jgi:hypothetical protein
MLEALLHRKQDGVRLQANSPEKAAGSDRRATAPTIISITT